MTKQYLLISVLQSHFFRKSSILIYTVFYLIFVAGPVEGHPPPRLFYTDWTVSPGGVYYMGANGERIFFRVSEGLIHNVVVGPDGVLYFSDCNANNFVRWTGGNAIVVYSHSTYVRDIDFDPQGRLYFSESFGAARDGKIYRLNDGVAKEFFRVSLASVNGFWAGNFAFAPDGTLYLSTGNRMNSYIYRVVDGTPTSIHSEPSGRIAGFDFDSPGNIYYTNRFHRIYRLSPDGIRTLVLEDGGRFFADVHVVATSVALGPEAGRVNSVVLHPRSTNILYAGTSSGGVFRSYNGGQSWYWRGQGIADPRIGELVVYPPNPRIILAVTQSGIFRSTNEGASWRIVLSVLRPFPPPDLPWAVVALQNYPLRYDLRDRALYAAPFCSGLFRSDNGGATWRQVYGATATTNLEKCVTSVDISPADGGTVFITTPTGIKKSVGGASPTWESIGAEIDDSDPVVLRVAPSKPDRIYVLSYNFERPPYNQNVWRRDSPGDAFARTTFHPPWKEWFYMMSMSVHPTNPDLLYVGSPALFRSDDAGSRWSLFGCSDFKVCGIDYRGLTFDGSGNKLYAAHDQGIYSFDATNEAFSAIEAGLVNTQFYDLDVGAEGTIYGGTQDRGGYRKTDTGVWERIASAGSGDVLDILVDPMDDRHLFIRTNTEKVLHSVDRGKTVNSSGYVPCPNFWNHQLAYDPSSTTLYVGTWFRGVYKSIDNGMTFSPANKGIERLEIRCLALEPGSNQTVYAGTNNDGLYKTTDGGANWQHLTDFPEVGALVIAISPTGDRIYAGTISGIYVSTDRGGSWFSINRGLPARRVVSEIIVDPDYPNLLYTGLGFYSGFYLYGGGVYQSCDRGNSWSRLSSSEHDATMSVTSIRIDPLDRSRLYVATYGSGIRTLFRDDNPRRCP